MTRLFWETGSSSPSFLFALVSPIQFDGQTNGGEFGLLFDPKFAAIPVPLEIRIIKRKKSWMRPFPGVRTDLLFPVGCFGGVADLSLDCICLVITRF